MCDTSYKQQANIITATLEHFDLVKTITYETISSIYPHYYPASVVQFFLNHHKEANILSDIHANTVYVLENKEKIIIGTVSIHENEIHRLFVLPAYQKIGYGSQLLAFAEDQIFTQYEYCIVDSSLPAKSLYLKAGYVFMESHKIETDAHDFLCYDVMRKYRADI